MKKGARAIAICTGIAYRNGSKLGRTTGCDEGKPQMGAWEWGTRRRPDGHLTHKRVPELQVHNLEWASKNQTKREGGVQKQLQQDEFWGFRLSLDYLREERGKDFQVKRISETPRKG